MELPFVDFVAANAFLRLIKRQIEKNFDDMSVRRVVDGAQSASVVENQEKTPPRAIFSIITPENLFWKAFFGANEKIRHTERLICNKRRNGAILINFGCKSGLKRVKKFVIADFAD